METLNNAWNEASSKMYESVKNQPGAGGAQQGPFAGGQPGGEPQQQQQQAPSGDQGGKKVENADFEVVEDK
jgi:hypothetical protein